MLPMKTKIFYLMKVCAGDSELFIFTKSSQLKWTTSQYTEKGQTNDLILGYHTSDSASS